MTVSATFAFKSVDFPTFGSPTMATGIPFFKTFPVANESIKRFNKFAWAVNPLLVKVQKYHCTLY